MLPAGGWEQTADVGATSAPDWKLPHRIMQVDLSANRLFAGYLHENGLRHQA